nr:hypothetical protein [Angustibacter aerolatus]
MFRSFDHSARTRKADDVLPGLLGSLGVALDEQPSDVDEQAALLRSVLADRRVLLLLDDVPDADSVRALRTSSPGSVTLVTTRRVLPGLVVHDGAREPRPRALHRGRGARAAGSPARRRRRGRRRRDGGPRGGGAPGAAVRRVAAGPADRRVVRAGCPAGRAAGRRGAAGRADPAGAAWRSPTTRSSTSARCWAGRCEP